jgi:hypothetical protein
MSVRAYFCFAKLPEEEKDITLPNRFQFRLCSSALAEDTPPAVSPTDGIAVQVGIEMGKTRIRHPEVCELLDNFAEMTEFLLWALD